MDLLKQCQQWFEQDEAQKVIDTLEAIPAEERTPELDSELAKAYIAVAHIGEREPFEKALELLAPHEEHFAEDHCWNYRIASAYYFLDEEGPALRYFEKALKARPGDKDTQEYINDCRRRLSLPRFEKNFRERTQEAWAAFSQIEAELRQIIETDETHQRGEELVEKCGNALKTALRDTSFELGFNGEKYELILSPEGLRSRLFPLVYFQKQAPESVLEHWNIWVGRQPCEGFELRAGEIEVRADDVQMWAEETEDHQVSLVLYCEKLTPILKEDTDKVWWALSMLVDQTIGEVSAIAFVAGFDVYAQPKDEPAKLLSELPELLQSMGLSLWRDGSDYLENSYLAYELKPVEDPEADWRLDVYTGSCRLPVLINDYLTARSDMVDEYHKDGIAAGFLLYPLSGFTGEERVKAILDFRDNLRDAILRETAEDFAKSESQIETMARAEELLPKMKAVAEEALARAGSADAVRVALVNMYFETREYDGTILPAGYYDAVRIELGAAEGHNWWCVLFPQLCIGTATEGPELEQIEKLAEGPEYRLSFALVEWLERLLAAGKETAIS